MRLPLKGYFLQDQGGKILLYKKINVPICLLQPETLTDFARLKSLHAS